ncbi:MAG: hypothetical protein Q8R25_02495 [bacterium]|nr:hypothetical protein [bacterium]
MSSIRIYRTSKDSLLNLEWQIALIGATFTPLTDAHPGLSEWIEAFKQQFEPPYMYFGVLTEDVCWYLLYTGHEDIERQVRKKYESFKFMHFPEEMCELIEAKKLN